MKKRMYWIGLGIVVCISGIWIAAYLYANLPPAYNFPSCITGAILALFGFILVVHGLDKE